MSHVPQTCNFHARVAFARRFAPFLARFAVLTLARQKLCLIFAQSGFGHSPHRATASSARRDYWRNLRSKARIAEPSGVKAAEGCRTPRRMCAFPCLELATAFGLRQ